MAATNDRRPSSAHAGHALGPGAQPACAACAPGRYSAASASLGQYDACTACAAGSVQPLPAQTGCTPCGAGRYAGSAEACADCPVGEVQPLAEVRLPGSTHMHIVVR